MKRIAISLLVVLITVMFLLSSCTNDTDSQEQTLWIVAEAQYMPEMTDNTDWQIQKVVSSFQQAHKDVTITLEFLPSEKEKPEERSVRLEQLRTEILAGGGADLYLIPIDHRTESPLFLDVQQAMRNGVFVDISSYYDADDALGKEDLITEVMDGGVMDGARYVLPISYNYAALLTEQSVMEAAGLDLEAAASDVFALYGALAATGDSQWCCSLNTLNSTSYSHFLP